MEKRSDLESADFRKSWRWVAGLIAVAGLLALFLFQRFDWSFWTTAPAIQKFVINRSIRFIVNDILGTLLVLALFGKRKLVIISIYVQVLGLIFVLVPYFILKMNYPAYNGPLLSFLHRLILNPVLIYLLIFFFWFQEKQGVIKS
jgi:exosortase F-associated protein